jgi:hypothetical protein
MTRYGYRIHIWNSISHNGKFSHNTERIVDVRLPERMNDRNVVFAANLILEPETKYQLHDGLSIQASGEYVKSVHFLGVATQRVVWDYSKAI